MVLMMTVLNTKQKTNQSVALFIIFLPGVTDFLVTCSGDIWPQNYR